MISTKNKKIIEGLISRNREDRFEFTEEDLLRVYNAVGIPETRFFIDYYLRGIANFTNRSIHVI